MPQLFHIAPPWPTPAPPGLQFEQKLRGRKPGDGVALTPTSDRSKQSVRWTPIFGRADKVEL